MTLSLTFDHRIVDGARRPGFSRRSVDSIENPGPWLIPEGVRIHALRLVGEGAAW